MNKQDLRDLIESLLIELDPEHTFNHEEADWLSVQGGDDPRIVGHIRFYDKDDVLLFEIESSEEGA